MNANEKIYVAGFWFLQKPATTQLLTAFGKSTQNASAFTFVYLTHFNMCVKKSSKFTHKLSKIYALGCRVHHQQFASVKRFIHFDKF